MKEYEAEIKPMIKNDCDRMSDSRIKIKAVTDMLDRKVKPN